MKRTLYSVAAGALAMYFFDPQAGRRRRARTRDKLDSAGRRLRDAYDVTLRDTRQRAMGFRAMGRRLLRREAPPDDDRLAGRVRAVLGRYCSHPHAIEVRASGGNVALAGPILAHEIAGLARAVQGVPGVQAVSSELVAHERPGNVSALQGGLPRRGRQWELMQDNWSPAARLMVGVLGLGLLVRGGFLGRLGGAALLARAATNLDFATLVGLAGAERGIEVQKTICVDAPVERVFEFWSHFENFPHFMTRVREVDVMGDRSHWIVRGPAGLAVEWTAEVTRMEPDSLIAWRSTGESDVKHEGEVRFEPDGDGTRVGVRLCYVPPAGALGHAVASLFGADPKTEMDADLMRMKSMIETGRTPHDAAQPA
jgi:uncharacterized membrane protein